MNTFTWELAAGPGGFGNGMHPTTVHMIEVLQELAAEGEFLNILDMGCGSGLLSMAACSLWPEAQVTAVDIQESAVETARENIIKNGFEGRIRVVHGNGYRHKAVLEPAPFDLVLANLVPDVHIALASQLPEIMAQDSLAVLSGILRWREEETIALYEQLGLELIAEPIREESGWCTLLLARSL